MELRVHGIGGPDPAGVLGCPPNASVVSWRSEADARSVVRCKAGDREVHMYHWSPLTSGSRSFALWPLLLPYTLVNVAGYMAPPGRSERRRALHRAGVVWVGLATTAATVAWLVVAAVAVWREVSGGDVNRRPGGMSGLWFTAAAVSAALAMALLVLGATHMATGFERYRRAGWPDAPRPWRWPWGAGLRARLDDPQFYDNGTEHEVRWRIHAAVAVVAWTAVVAAVLVGGTERAGHLLGRSLVVVGLLQSLGAALVAVAGLLPAEGDDRRLTRRLLGSATAVLGILLLGGLVLSALIAVTGIDEVPPGAVAVLYDCYGWAILAAVGTAVACAVLALLTPVLAEKGPARVLLPTAGARLRARLATFPSDVDRIVVAMAVAFSAATLVAVAVRWGELDDDTWRLTATPPVNIARATFAFVLAFTVLNLVKSRAAPAALKRIGNVWDILTFWPRAFHPFAVRPYAERAVPELQEFMATAPRRDDLVVVAHSQGTVLAYAAIRPSVAGRDDPLPPFTLVTFGSPLRSLYAAVFPYYFDVAEFDATRRGIPGGWLNCFRVTDHVGRSVFAGDDGAATGDRPLADARAPSGTVLGHNDYWVEPEIRAAVTSGAVTSERTA
ncbi:MAG TPA: hypothetical protein VHF27_02715 [Acidimicrobiales bacterium]|nr:hypothetical protein [Acidimicrobiales bacterium]